jgi:hypothetical protein
MAIMNESRTLTIELSALSWQQIEAEALRVNHPTEMVLKMLLETHPNLSQSRSRRKLKPKHDLSLAETLTSLRAIASQQAILDAVQLARESREDLIQRGIF